MRALCVPGMTSSNTGQAKPTENASSATFVTMSTNHTECSLLGMWLHRRLRSKSSAKITSTIASSTGQYFGSIKREAGGYPTEDCCASHAPDLLGGGSPPSVA